MRRGTSAATPRRAASVRATPLRRFPAGDGAVAPLRLSMSSAHLISHGRRWVAQENLLVDHDESSVQAVSFNYLRAEWKVPLQYPVSTPSLTLQYPFISPSVPLQYPFSTPSLTLSVGPGRLVQLLAPSGRSPRRDAVPLCAASLVACCTHTPQPKTTPTQPQTTRRPRTTQVIDARIAADFERLKVRAAHSNATQCPGPLPP